MRCSMKVVKDVNSKLLAGIIPLPSTVGPIVTVTVSDYVPQRQASKEEMRAAMKRLENGIVPSNRSLDSFRAERLAKYEAVN